MKILRARLYQVQMKRLKEQAQSEYLAKQDIAWGSQIRSYVMHPYSMVKDHRTEYETGNVQKVMDGDLDGFIEAWLKLKIKKPETKNQ